MKHPKQNYVILGALISVALLALAGLYYFSRQFIDAEDLADEDPHPAFVQHIEEYALVTGNARLGDERCSPVAADDSTPEDVIEICERSMAAEYKDSDTGHVVFVHLIQVTRNSDRYLELLERVSTVDQLHGHPVVRLDGSEIGWFPAEDFDIIVTEEGTLTTTGFSYASKAQGTNAVTQHFIGAYPPEDR